MHHHTGPFTIPAIRDIVPEKVKPWIVLVFGLIFQLSGGIYMAAVSEMKGSLSLMQEDIMMAGYASLVGVALTFTIMFRLKFYLPMRESLIITSLGVAVCNLITMHTGHLPVLVAFSFICGIFRMWGTFTCFSNIQLWITPKRDMAVWFCFVPLMVQDSIQLSGIMAIYTAWLSKWEYMHLAIIGLLLLITLLAVTLFRHHRAMPKLPLFGIDWPGMFLWGVTLVSAIFVLNYGEHYDWFSSVYMCAGALFALVSLALNLWRASFIRHPFIDLRTWTFQPVWLTFVLYIVIDILLGPVHSFEHIFTEGVLGYDSLSFIRLNWLAVTGIVSGVCFTYLFFAKRRWTYKRMSVIGFCFIVAYLILMYFTLDANLPKERLYLPVVLRSFGYTIIGAVFITSLTTIPFPNFVQSLSVQAFMSACLGGVIGDALITRIFSFVMKKNVMLAEANLDRVNPVVAHAPHDVIYGQLQIHSLMVSMKEVYGWLCIAGLFLILIFLLWESSLRPSTFHPKWSTIRREIRRELRSEEQ